jgi:hypothetical protein
LIFFVPQSWGFLFSAIFFVSPAHAGRQRRGASKYQEKQRKIKKKKKKTGRPTLADKGAEP